MSVNLAGADYCKQIGLLTTLVRDTDNRTAQEMHFSRMLRSSNDVSVPLRSIQSSEFLGAMTISPSYRH